MRSPLILPALALSICILLAQWLTPPVWLFFVVGAISMLISVLPSALRVPALMMVWGCVGVLRTADTTALPAHHVARTLREEPVAVVGQGMVVSDQMELLDPNEEGQVAVIRVRHLKIDQRWAPAVGLVRARILEPRIPLAYWDEVVLE